MPLSPFFRPVYAQLVPMYSSPTRGYHSMSHIEHLLRAFPSTRPDGTKWSQTVFEFIHDLIWFHDAYYDMSTPGFNEEMSLQIARTLLEHRGEDGYDRFWDAYLGDVFALAIRMTARHVEDIDVKKEVYAGAYAFGQRLALLDELIEAIEAFLDADMSMFAETNAWVLQQVEMSLIRESRMIPSEIFWSGRVAFFEKLLAREKLFYSAAYQKHEENAKRQIARQLSDAREVLERQAWNRRAICCAA